MQLIKQPADSIRKFGAVIGLPTGYDATKQYPLIIFCAGLGGIGSGSSADLDKLINGEIPLALQQGCDKYGFILVAPQTGSAYVQGEVNFALKSATSQYKIDTNRIYLTGLSLGGGATWYEVEQSLTNASLFAAIAPIATTWQVGKVDSIVQAGLPVWAFHNLNDTNGATPSQATISQVTAINAVNPKVPAAMTIFNQSGHGGWGEAYSDVIPIPVGSQGFVNPTYNIYQWFLSNSLGKPVAAGNPIVVPVPPVSVRKVTGIYQITTYDSGAPDFKSLPV